MPILTALPRHAAGRAPTAAALCLLTAVAIFALRAAAPGAGTGNEHSITSPDPSVNGIHISLVFDAAGNPVVAYLDGPLQDLKLLPCRAPDCTQPTTPKPSPSPTTTPAATPTPAALAGDADCSTAIDTIDAALILQFAAGLVGSLPCVGGADANGDGLVNSIDSALVLQLVAGLISSLPP